MISRRRFVRTCITAPLFFPFLEAKGEVIITVNGKIRSADLGMTLIHEHVLVDFIGADKITSDRWKHDDVIKKVLPYLLEIKQRGIKSILECTPAFIGRDVLLLQKLSQLSGLQILTNTGFYGASDNKYLPAFAQTESAELLARRWINEFENGVEGTAIRPGFIKIGVNSGALSNLHQKLVKAAALTHLKTGLTICAHTGPALPAAEEVEILKNQGVHPSAFVWVHANGSDADFMKLATAGCWISMDGVGENNMIKNADTISLLKNNGFLNQVLISHDAGWYRPGEPDGGEFRGYTTISDKFIPFLKTKGFSNNDVEQLMVKNPATAFAVRVRKI